MSNHADVIVDAIKNRLQISFRYRSQDETEGTERIVEPWIYGTRNGKECLYGYVVSGGSGPGMKRFNLEKVRGISLTGEHIENHPETLGDITKWDEVIAAWDHKIAA